MATDRISIHAPRVGSDLSDKQLGHLPQDFNPRSPCGERPPRRRYGVFSRPFQSTLPVWGATTEHFILERFPDDFNPRSPCGERLGVVVSSAASMIFQSTLPVWGATRGCKCDHAAARISIHAPRVGSDRIRPMPGWRASNFNPRSPCGERRFVRLVPVISNRFQSTLPVWGATPAGFSRL